MQFAANWASILNSIIFQYFKIFFLTFQVEAAAFMMVIIQLRSKIRRYHYFNHKHLKILWLYFFFSIRIGYKNMLFVHAAHLQH